MSPRTVPPEAFDGGLLEPIAICGMACRLPGGVNSESSFWQMLLEKRTGQTAKVPESRFSIDAHLHENLDRPGSFNISGGYFLDDRPEDFDPTFFNITPVEAQWLDPQQRRMLEIGYECITSAGCTLDDISGSNTAVFVGSFTSDYQQISTREPDFRHNYAATGVDTGIISSRISNTFNLKGPSFTINTACSSSIYALHNACLSLRARDCDAAIVGGVNLIITVDQHMNTAKLGILSPTSTCHTFDEAADGYGRGEAAGALYIKRMSDAIRCGDPIRGVIRATAVNTNGKVPGMGITHPSLEGQERVVRTAYQMSGLDPNVTAYAELHGTGTPVGDPIEVRAISNAMNDTREKQKPLIIGAAKPNIGHSEAASGIFAVMKGALMTESAVIPGVALLNKINPAILESEWNVKINKNTSPWPKEFPIRRASISSFGYGGTNGHVVVEAIETLYPSYRHAKPKKDALYDHSTERAVLLCLSGHDNLTLSRLTKDIAALSSRYYTIDLAHTLNIHRTAFSQRAFTVLRAGQEEEAFEAPALRTGSASSKTSPGLAFIFTGQGAQWVGMGRVAMAEFPVFAGVIRSLDLVLAKFDLDRSSSLEDFLVSDPGETASVLADPIIAQPLCTAIQIALVDVFSQWDIDPTVSIGHSSGEIAAAYASGLISAPEAIIAAYCRGMAVQLHSETGSMLAVGLGAAEVQSFLPKNTIEACIACENSPESVTISGQYEAMIQLKESLSAKGIFTRELRTDRAYHSPHMDDVATAYESCLTTFIDRLDQGDLRWRRARSEMVSSVTGERVVGATLPDNYFSLNLRQRVRFNAAVQKLASDEAFAKVNVAIEIGPHSALSGPFKQICKAARLENFTYIPSMVRAKSDADQLLSVAGSLFLTNYPVNLEEVNSAAYESRERGVLRKSRTQYLLVDLPPFPWNYGKTHWYEPRGSAEQRARAYPRHDLLGRRVSGLSTSSRAWRNILRARDVPWLLDHSLGGSAIFPAAGYLAMAIEAARQVYETEISSSKLPLQQVTLRDISIKTALTIPDKENGGVETLLTLSSKETSAWHTFIIESFGDDGLWTTHCNGRVRLSTDVASRDPSLRQPTLPANEKMLTQRVPATRCYRAFRSVGFHYGRAFQQLQYAQINRKIHQADGGVMVREYSGLIQGESRAVIHPVTIDSCIQLIIISIHADKQMEMPWGVVPTHIEEVSMAFPDVRDIGPTIGYAKASSDAWGKRRFNANVQLIGNSGKTILDIKNLTCIPYEAALPLSASTPPSLTPFSTSVWKPDLSKMDARQLTQFLSSEEGMDPLGKLVELAAHRQPIRKVLVLQTPTEGNINAVLSQVPSTTVVTIGYYSDTNAVPSLAEDVTARISLLPLAADPETWDPSLKDAFDIVVIDDASPKKIMPLVSEHGWIFGRVKKTCFSHASSLDIEEHYALQRSARAIAAIPAHLQLLSFSDSIDDSDDLVAVLKAKHIRVSRTKLADYQPVSDAFIIIDDRKDQFFSCLNNASFDALKNVFKTSIPILWLTKGVQHGHSMVGGMASGFLRVVCSELSAVSVTLLDYNDEEDFDILTDTITQLLLHNSPKAAGRENEFWLKKGVLHVSRLVPDTLLNRDMNTESELNNVQSCKASSNQPMKIRTMDGKVVLKPVAQDTALGPAEVEIRLSSAEEHFEDVTQTLVIGTVTRTGDLLPSDLTGKRVVGHVTGELTTFARTEVFVTLDNEESIAHVNDQTLIEAVIHLSSILDLLLDRIHMQRGDTLLILSGPQATVTALARLSKARGWVLVIAVASEADKTRYEASALFEDAKILAEDDIEGLICYVETHAGTGHKASILAHNFTELSREIWRHVPSFANFVLLNGDFLGTLVPDATPFTRGACFITAPQNRALPLTSLARCLGEIQRNPDITYSFSGSENDISTDKEVRRRTIDLRHAESRFGVLPQTASRRLSSDATYLLVGCLGGVGRSLTRRMMELGARNFAFVSRSGADRSGAAALFEAIRNLGGTVTVFRADVSDEVAIRNIVKKVSARQTIKGVVHAAMVLKDGLFEEMDFDSFEAAITPKARGAVALHNALQEVQNLSLDFFVLTSSISTLLGNTGQSNYSAANGVLESLARFRSTHGLPTSSLALPMVLDVGVVAETDGLEDLLSRKGLYGIYEEEMLRGFEVAMTHTHAQPISMGMEVTRLSTAIAAAPTDSLELYWQSDARFCHIHAAMKAMGTQKVILEGSAAQNFPETLASTMKRDGCAAAVQMAAAYIAKRVSIILMLSVDDIDLDGPSVASYGLDSMVGSEMRNWLFKNFGLDYPFQQLLAPTLTFTKLARQVMESIGIIETSLAQD